MPPEVYRGFGFPGADDLGNMFQFKRDFNDYFCGARDLEFARSLNPELQTFDAVAGRAQGADSAAGGSAVGVGGTRERGNEGTTRRPVETSPRTRFLSVIAARWLSP